MDRFLEIATSFFRGSKYRRKKVIGKEQPGNTMVLNSSDQNVDKSQNEKEGKLKDKGKLFVGGLNFATTSKELSVYFSKFGDVINCVVIKSPITGKSLGYGFVSFTNPADAEKALQTKHHLLHDKIIECRLYESKETKTEGAAEGRVFLGGLPADVTKEELQEFFSRYGKVSKVYIPTNRNTKKGKGFAFLSFENEDDGKKCISERFVYLKERRVFINKAVPRDMRPRADVGISESYDSVTDEDSFCMEDSESLPDEDTQSSSSGQLNLELEQRPEFQQLFRNYFTEKLTYYNGMSGKEVENSRQQLQNNEIEKLENFLRGVSINSHWNSDEDSDSESSDSNTKDDSSEEGCEDLASLLLPQGEFGECASENSIGKITNKVTLDQLEKERPYLKSSTQEIVEGRLQKSSAPVSSKESTNTLTCGVCGWTPADQSFETFLAHLKTVAHKMKLIERFSESNTQGAKVEPKEYSNSKKQKDTLSEVKFYPKVTGIDLDNLQRQKNTQNDQKCGKMQQTQQLFQQLPEQALRRQLVEQKEEKEVQKVEKVQKQRKNKKNEQKQSHQETKGQMNNPNLKIYALVKGMASIQALSGNKLNCEMCNKLIPESSDFDVLMKNVSQHLQSRKHLQKLLQTENKLKSSAGKNLEPGGTSSLNNKNSKEESVKKKKIPTKKVKVPPKDTKSLSTGKASLEGEKKVLASEKPNPKDVGVKPQNAVPKQKTGKTEDSEVKMLCLRCNLSTSTVKKFYRHLESKQHSGTSTPDGPKIKVQNPQYTECSFCNTFLFGSLYEINVHFSECVKQNLEEVFFKGKVNMKM